MTWLCTRPRVNLLLWLFTGSLTSLVYCQELVEQQQIVICQGETFAPSCGSDEILYIQSAEYGDMGSEPCSLGVSSQPCSVYVFAVSFRCSGRRTCEISISDPDFTETFNAKAPCSGNVLSPYLHVMYICLKVITPDLSQCSAEFYPVSLPEGIIASLTSQETPCGRSNNPWRIEARPDESVMLTIDTFEKITGSNTESNPDVASCNVLVETKELMSGKKNRIGLCGGHEYQVSPIYDGPVEVVVHPESESGPNYFIIIYEVFGCPEIPPIAGARVFNRKEFAAIICEDTGVQWNFVCIGNAWLDRTRMEITPDELQGICASKPLVN